MIKTVIFLLLIAIGNWAMSLYYAMKLDLLPTLLCGAMTLIFVIATLAVIVIECLK